MKLKAKIHLYSTLLAILTLLAVNGLSYYLFENYSYSSAANPLRADVQQVATALSQVQNQTEIPTILRAYAPENGALRVMGEGSISYAVETEPLLRSYEADVNLNEAFTKTDTKDGTVLSVATTALLGSGEIVTITLHQLTTSLDATLALLFRTFVIATLLGAVLLFSSNFLLGRQVTAPIEQLIRHIQGNRERGSYRVISVDGRKKEETAVLAREFNSMMEKLGENYNKQEQFVANAAHELKTPLTIIESYANLLKRRGTSDVEVTAEAIEAITSETERMKWMVEQFLELARSQQAIEIERQSLNVVTLTQDLAHQLERLYSREIVVEATGEVWKSTDSARLRQLLTVLIDNAKKYSETPIYVSIDSSRIEVKDQGVGIPEKDLPHVFDRFYRVDEARARGTGGSGVGLAIAKELANQLHLDISISSELGKGTAVKLQFLEDRSQ
ncbi:hypothetical protein CF394_05965 [Tetzosporium hominis]|uniref:histidine kinase n=1 Tax=Tetzosporium hominis TaxID=2020506 RepID=A0A264W3Y5_9BACL|nr:HAMP domain-containing sensor histidine kinase [Tetzosporium hominis]OZS78303.1 hypothetical protein CF394_05965 [Tetzosporium hominis]